MTLSVVKCILCSLLMLWISNNVTHRNIKYNIVKYSINMTKSITSYDIMWLYSTWVFNKIRYLSLMTYRLIYGLDTKDEFRNTFSSYIWIVLFGVYLFYDTFPISPFVLKDSPIDLIIGRKTIQKCVTMGRKTLHCP